MEAGFIQTGNLDQLKQVVGMTEVHFLLVRKLAASRSLCDASLERAFNGVTSQVKSAIGQTDLKERCRFPQPDN